LSSIGPQRKRKQCFKKAQAVLQEVAAEQTFARSQSRLVSMTSLSIDRTGHDSLIGRRVKVEGENIATVEAAAGR
jgi:hypothetical protein